MILQFQAMSVFTRKMNSIYEPDVPKTNTLLKICGLEGIVKYLKNPRFFYSKTPNLNFIVYLFRFLRRDLHINKIDN